MVTLLVEAEGKGPWLKLVKIKGELHFACQIGEEGPANRIAKESIVVGTNHGMAGDLECAHAPSITLNILIFPTLDNHMSSDKIVGAKTGVVEVDFSSVPEIRIILDETFFVIVDDLERCVDAIVGVALGVAHEGIAMIERRGALVVLGNDLSLRIDVDEQLIGLLDER